MSITPWINSISKHLTLKVNCADRVGRENFFSTKTLKLRHRGIKTLEGSKANHMVRTICNWRS